MLLRVVQEMPMVVPSVTLGEILSMPLVVILLGLVVHLSVAMHMVEMHPTAISHLLSTSKEEVIFLVTSA